MDQELRDYLKGMEARLKRVFSGKARAEKPRPRSTRGGHRPGAGRPPSAEPRCACNTMSLRRALARCPQKHNAIFCRAAQTSAEVGA